MLEYYRRLDFLFTSAKEKTVQPQAQRQMAHVQDELPKYLLAPEVSALLHYVPDLHRKMLLATLWNTGARISEALAMVVC